MFCKVVKHLNKFDKADGDADGELQPPDRLHDLPYPLHKILPILHENTEFI